MGRPRPLLYLAACMASRKRIAIVQSNYIPWKGYFDLIAAVDEFVLFDHMQYTRRDWRNRNRIKTRQGTQWLSVPVAVSGKYLQTIRETEVSDPDWAERHWRTLSHAYAQAPCFREIGPSLRRLYEDVAGERYLSQINRRMLEAICGMLGIRTRLSWSWDYELTEGKTERLVALCQQAGAGEYLSGPTARGYVDEGLFAQAGIRLSWMDYGGYREYPQLFPPFDHHVSVVDLLCNTGADARDWLLAAGRAAEAG